MDFLSTLLSFVISLATTLLIALQSVVGGSAPNQGVVVLPAPPTHVVATSSSISIIGTSTPSVSPKKQSVTAAKIVTPKPAATTTPGPVPTPTISAEELNTTTRTALVNILCFAQGGNIHSISGSGVFIDTRGVILTNAHIGQYFLLKDYPTSNNVDCVIRTGSPAQPRYHAKLLYLPLPWVIDNASQLTLDQAKGTGENDYAFLVITGSTGPDPLPATFPALPMTTAGPDTGDAAFLAAYPAGFLGGATIEKSLYSTSAYASVKDLFTFSDAHTVDLFSIGGTIVSQGGSSGGIVARANDGKLDGLIVTETPADTTAARDLRAITISHIERSLIANGQGGILNLLSQDLTQATAKFASSTAIAEKELLVKVIEHR